jgi:hypothetical protein
MRTPNAFNTLSAAVNSDSPDDILRDAALNALGPLGDDRAIPLLQQWIVVGKPISERTSALTSLAQLDRKNQQITQEIASYLTEPRAGIRSAAIQSLGIRGDASAIPALEAMLKRSDLSIEVAPMIKEEIAELQKAKDGKSGQRGGSEDMQGMDEGASGDQSVAQRLARLERLMHEVNERLKSIENRLPPKQ